jgi:hypothetical protein
MRVFEVGFVLSGDVKIFNSPLVSIVELTIRFWGWPMLCFFFLLKVKFFNAFHCPAVVSAVPVVLVPNPL